MWPFNKKEETPVYNPEAFQSENWDTLTDEEKRSQLQALENKEAEEQGRKARTVEIDETAGEGEHGVYKSDGNGGGTIQVSKYDLDHNQYECMDTVYHEGRHAYQDDVVHKRISHNENKETVNQWTKDDKEGYIGANEAHSQGRDFDYRFQAQERDAYDYAREKMDGNEAIQNDPRFQEYAANRDYNDLINQYQGEEFYEVNGEQAVCEKTDTVVQSRCDTAEWQNRNQPQKAEDKSETLSQSQSQDAISR